MASVAGNPEAAGNQFRTEAMDRWIFVFMAALFFVTALAGFIPDSLMKIAAVKAGERAPFPLVLHVHAVLMGAWLSLLLAQTTLMATGNARHHKKLGIAAFLLAPAIVITGMVLVPTMHALWRDGLAIAPADAQARLQAAMIHRNNIVLTQLRSGILFLLFVILALRARATDSGFHKRMIILATVVPLPAAIARLTWLPSTTPASPVSTDLYTLLWLAPMFAWDLYRHKGVHRAYKVWLAFWLPATALVNLLWGTTWWQATAPRLLGF